MEFKVDVKKKCVYCASLGPFSDEHVFPAGMGGDDNNFLLIDSVCANCNTNVFSGLELSLMRRSPTGLGRKFMQSKTRERGAHTSKPTIETRNHFIVDESGRLLEAEDDKHGIETILAQCIFEGGKIHYTAQDSPHLLKLYKALETALNTPTINIIKKIGPKIFDITTYEWIDDNYNLSKQETLNKPPSTGIWSATPSDNSKTYESRFFQRLKGQIVLKTQSSETHATLLRSMRRTLPSIQNKHIDAQPNTINNPLVQIEMSVDIPESERAIAKIGLNLFIHTFGATAANHAEFDQIKNSILTGCPELPFSSFGENTEETISDLFGNTPEKSHCAMLMAIPSTLGGRDIYFNAKFYGTGTHKVLLASNSTITELEYPIYFLINYETNKIEKLSMLEYQLKHGTIMDRLPTNPTRHRP